MLYDPGDKGVLVGDKKDKERKETDSIARQGAKVWSWERQKYAEYDDKHNDAEH